MGLFWSMLCGFVVAWSTAMLFGSALAMTSMGALMSTFLATWAGVGAMCMASKTADAALVRASRVLGVVGMSAPVLGAGYAWFAVWSAFDATMVLVLEAGAFPPGLMALSFAAGAFFLWTSIAAGHRAEDSEGEMQGQAAPV